MEVYCITLLFSVLELYHNEPIAFVRACVSFSPLVGTVDSDYHRE